MRTLSSLGLLLVVPLAVAWGQATTYRTKGTNVGCVYRSDYETVRRYVLVDDVKAAAQFMAQTPTCAFLKPGLKVYLEDIAPNGSAQIRVAGTTVTWWTHVAAIGSPVGPTAKGSSGSDRRQPTDK